MPGKCEELSLNLQPLGVEAQACKPLLLGVGEGGQRQVAPRGWKNRQSRHNGVLHIQWKTLLKK